MICGGKDPHGCHYPPSDWPRSKPAADDAQEESDESSVATCNLVTMEEPLIPVDKFSSFTHYKRIGKFILSAKEFNHNFCYHRSIRSTPGNRMSIELNTNYAYFNSLLYSHLTRFF